VDGNDVIAVYEAAETAVNRARVGEGPTLIECKTYRWRGHTERPGQTDPRPQDEVEEWQQKDPINRLATSLIAQQLLSEEAWQKMDAEILAAVEDSVKFSLDSPFPAPETAVEDVFAE
jgi:pyruvate dehydrogenase E1 component alpha subunit